MKKIGSWILRFKIWKDAEGQDFVEYALIAGLAAAAAGLFLPEMSESMDTIYSRLASKLVEAHSE